MQEVSGDGRGGVYEGDDGVVEVDDAGYEDQALRTVSHLHNLQTVKPASLEQCWRRTGGSRRFAVMRAIKSELDKDKFTTFCDEWGFLLNVCDEAESDDENE